MDEDFKKDEKVEKVISEEKFPKVEQKYKQSKKKYLLANKHSYPYELRLGRLYLRFEPAGKEGYIVEVDKDVIEHFDFASHKNHLVVTEVK